MRVIFLGMLMGFALLAAGIADATHPAGQAGEQAKTKFTKHFNESLFAITEDALFSVEIVLNENEYKIGRDVFGIVIHDAHDEDVEGASVQAIFRKPGGEKSLTEMLSVKEKGRGLYSVEKFDLEQNGDLEIRVKVKKGDREDSAFFALPDVTKEKLTAGRYDKDSIAKKK